MQTSFNSDLERFPDMQNLFGQPLEERERTTDPLSQQCTAAAASVRARRPTCSDILIAILYLTASVHNDCQELGDSLDLLQVPWHHAVIKKILKIMEIS